MVKMLDILFNIVSFGLKPIYEKHLEYYKIIEEFRNKLPRKQNEARAISDEEKNKHPLFSELKGIQILDLSSHKTSLSEADIDYFYNSLNNFDYRYLLFKEYYKKYTANLNRFNPRATNKDFDLAIVQLVLQEKSYNPLKPLDVLIFHLKWKIKATSKIYRLLFGK